MKHLVIFCVHSKLYSWKKREKKSHLAKQNRYCLSVMLYNFSERFSYRVPVTFL